LLDTTTKRFTVAEVSADKGYLGRTNFEEITNAGATPYIPFKSNTTGEGPELWRRPWHFHKIPKIHHLLMNYLLTTYYKLLKINDKYILTVTH